MCASCTLVGRKRRYKLIQSNFNTPDLKEIVDQLNQEGNAFFDMFQASILPGEFIDFRNMGLTTKGLSGSRCIIDTGKIQNIIKPSEQKKYFCTEQIAQEIGKKIIMIGAGLADTEVHHGSPAELILNGSKSMSAYSKGRKKFCTLYPYSDIQAFGNFYGCEGTSDSSILTIEANKRIKNINFCETIYTILQPFGDIGLGGIITVTSHLQNDKCIAHIIHSLPEKELSTTSELESYVNIFKAPLPITAVTTIVTDKSKREYGHTHSHFWSTGGREVIGGHFRIDDCPETVTYKGYFSLAEKYYYFK